MEQREYYQCPPGTNCWAAGKPVDEKRTGKSLSANPSSPDFLKATKVRTAYDQYWLKFYNNRSNNYETNMMTLQFTSDQ
jgi:hypothetical protein